MTHIVFMTFESATSGSGGGPGPGGPHVPTKIFVFNNNGIYTPTAGIASVVVECVGGGGGGGAAVALNAGGGAGGGGSGGYSRRLLMPAQIGSSQTVTVGAGGAGGVAGVSGAGNGGTTSFGSLVTALGGIASVGFNPTGQSFWGLGGNGAGIGTGDVVLPGQPGENGSVLGASGSGTNLAVIGGTGGAMNGGGG